MFSETRYALNGDLRVAYRTSREGPRDIVFIPSWFTNCEVVPELPSIQGWVEAMASLGRLIFFDQPGTGASDPVTAGALPTLEQWADSITAVLDELGSSEGPPGGRRRVGDGSALRSDTSGSHNRAGRPRGLCGCA
jgi:pimeloyl-ACP methyl ester carboxylesterase